MKGSAEMESMRKPGEQHVIHIEQRKGAQLTGITDVCSFHENEIVLKTEGRLLVVSGQNMHIEKLLLDEGKVQIEGLIDGVVYEAPSAAIGRWWFWKKEKK